MKKKTLQKSPTFFLKRLEEKLKISIDNSPHFRGYTQVGGEYTLGTQDWREELDLGFEGEVRKFIIEKITPYVDEIKDYCPFNELEKTDREMMEHIISVYGDKAL